MSLLKGIFLGIAYWLVVLLLLAEGLRRDDARLLAASAGLVLIFLVIWRWVWRRRRRASKSRRVPIPAAVRRQVYARDGFRCVYCGRGGRSLRLTIDHVFPVALGGNNDIANLVTACRACNLTKGARLMNDAGLRRYANERRDWAGRERRRGCLVRLGVVLVGLAVLGAVVEIVLR
jgi:5-methylcytosine-specific restriction protein A